MLLAKAEKLVNQNGKISHQNDILSELTKSNSFHFYGSVKNIKRLKSRVWGHFVTRIILSRSLSSTNHMIRGNPNVRQRIFSEVRSMDL